MNLIAYCIYTFIIVTIILRVGHLCYKNGKVFTAQLIPLHESLNQQINKSLLAGYYLVNLGYGITVISNWETVEQLTDLVYSITYHIAMLMLLLALLHYINLFTMQFILTKSLK